MYHFKGKGAPRKDGLHETILGPDKVRAYGLRGFIRISPRYTETQPKGLILQGEMFTPKTDLLVHDS